MDVLGCKNIFYIVADNIRCPSATLVAELANEAMRCTATIDLHSPS